MAALLKICGLSTSVTVAAALDAGADMLGFVFHPNSPRYVTPEAAGGLARPARGKAAIVALAVDADDALLAEIKSALRPDLWQLHGSESLERVRDVRAVFGVPVMKAAGISSGQDLARARAYAGVADRILLDAPPPPDAAYPGGHGAPFDWALLNGLGGGFPFMLSGGLTPENIDGAVRTVRGFGADLAGVDVSSGVERAPGVKDAAKISSFARAFRAAFA